MRGSSFKQSLFLGLAAAALLAVGVFFTWSWISSERRKQEIKQLSLGSSNLKQIYLGVIGFDRGRMNLFKDITDKTGKPLLSWRVAILPYIGGHELYHQFKLDEPWDSEHNLKLAKLPVPGYSAPHQKVRVDAQGHYLSHLMLFTGKGSLFSEGRGMGIHDIPDGMSKTILCVEAKSPCIWTKPQDIPFDIDKEFPPLDSVVGIHPEEFTALLCDGSVHDFKMSLDRETMKSLIAPDDGKPDKLP